MNTILSHRSTNKNVIPRLELPPTNKRILQDMEKERPLTIQHPPHILTLIVFAIYLMAKRVVYRQHMEMHEFINRYKLHIKQCRICIKRVYTYG